MLDGHEGRAGRRAACQRGVNTAAGYCRCSDYVRVNLRRERSGWLPRCVRLHTLLLLHIGSRELLRQCAAGLVGRLRVVRANLRDASRGAQGTGTSSSASRTSQLNFPEVPLLLTRYDPDGARAKHGA